MDKETKIALLLYLEANEDIKNRVLQILRRQEQLVAEPDQLAQTDLEIL